MLGLIPKLAGFAFQMVGVLWLAIVGAWGAYEYDRAPCGWPNYPVKVLFIHFTVHFHDSMGCTNGKLLAAEAAALKQAERVELADQQATANTQATVAAARVQIEYRTRTLIEEIHDQLNPALDRAWPLSVGFVRAHDASALGLGLSAVAAPAGRTDDSASLVASSTLASIIASNYGDCRADANQLAGWQAWYAQLEKDRERPPAPPP